MGLSVRPQVRPTTASLLLVWLFVGITACGPARSTPVGGSRDVVTRGQILSLPDGTAFSVLELLRPRWLRARIQATPSNPTPVFARVHVDDLLWGPLESLRQISTNSIQRIEYLSALDATTRYGTGYMGGLIRVVTR